MNLVDNYRPKTFSGIVGHPTDMAQLQAELAKETGAQSFIISGPFGCGKTSVARIIAKYVNCLNPYTTKVEPCCLCSSCVSIANGTSPDVIELNASEARSIDDVRSWISNSVFAPRNKKKVYILDEFQGLPRMSQEAFLKSLEEPPQGTLFILCTTASERILQPIQSRCQHINLQLLDKEVVVEHLKKIASIEDVKIADSVFEIITDKCGGHLRDAMQSLQVIFNLYNSGQRITEDKIIQYIEAQVEVAPEKMVQKFLFGIYTKNYTAALRVAKVVPNPDYFISVILEHHMQTLFNSANPEKLVDSRYKGFLNLLQVQVPKQKLSRIMSVFTETASDIRAHLTDARVILVNSACRALQIMEE